MIGQDGRDKKRERERRGELTRGDGIEGAGVCYGKHVGGMEIGSVDGTMREEESRMVVVTRRSESSLKLEVCG